ncbi:MAG: PilX N-terminal domain-containing pilus assembly protein [Candidatus Berkiella sp.]
MNKLPKLMHQQGVVLITGLIFLLVLTLIGISTMGNSAITERMTQNFRDTSSAFEAAEAALADGEYWLRTQTNPSVAVSTCSTPPCKIWSYNASTNFAQLSDSWWQTQAIPFSSSLYGVSSQPVYMMEQYTFVPYDLSPDSVSKGRGYYYYRVTAKGVGATSTSRAIIQSMYATQYN